MTGRVFVFDVDGTLTPSRQKINKEFASWLESFFTHNAVYLVTGSDREKTLEQVGPSLYNLAHTVYQCSGNHVFQQDREIYRTDWKLPDLARTFLISCEYESQFPLRTGNHIEERPGVVNFSVVGRNATLDERKLYVEYDTKENDRRIIAEAFNTMFPDIEAVVAGETGLDIFPRGANKGQIIDDFIGLEVYFFGDKMDEDGNDYPLAALNKNGKNYHVRDWEHTWELLREL